MHQCVNNTFHFTRLVAYIISSSNFYGHNRKSLVSWLTIAQICLRFHRRMPSDRILRGSVTRIIVIIYGNCWNPYIVKALRLLLIRICECLPKLMILWPACLPLSRLWPEVENESNNFFFNIRKKKCIRNIDLDYAFDIFKRN